ncbi:MAG: CHAT domain-containing protein [Cyanobacteria bacterium P01_G01_bin.38]
MNYRQGLGSFLILLLGLSPAVLAQPAEPDAAQQLQERGESLLELDAYRSAVPTLEQALRLYQTASDTDGIRDTALLLGAAYYRLGKYGQAERTLRLAEQTFSLTPEHQRHLWLFQGLVRLEFGDVLQAQRLLHRAQGAVGGPPDLDESRQIRIGLGQTYRVLGHYSRALSYLEQARRTSGSRSHLITATAGVGDIYYDLGDYGQAQDIYTEALALSHSTGDRLAVSRNLNRLGQTYRQQKAYDPAIEAFQDARNIAIAIGDTIGLERILNNLGETYLEQGELDSAETTFEEALGYTRRGDISQTRSLLNLGQLSAARSDYSEALVFYDDAYRWADYRQEPIAQIKVLGRRAQIWYQQNQLADAQSELDQALELFEQLNPGLFDSEKVSLFETQAYLYELMQQTQVAQGQPEAALATAERGRARAFAELLTARDLTPPPSVVQLRQLAQQSTLVQYSIVRQPSPSHASFTDDQLLIWVIQPNGEIAFRQVELSALETPLTDLVQITQAAIGVRSFGELFEATFLSPGPSPGPTFTVAVSPDSDDVLRQLHDVLIEPIAEQLPDDPMAKVLFVPHRSLFLVPFAALKNSQGRYLIEDHTIAIAPSLQTLDLLQQRSPSVSSDFRPAVIVGNPQMPKLPPKLGQSPQQLAALPGAEAEAVAIAPLLNAQPLIGSAATETAVRAQLTQAKTIHLATHGFFDDQQGLQSAIALTPATDEAITELNLADSAPDDGLLTAQEVLNLTLQADLVVLSACNTGRGKITGDGVVGLSRSFLGAGANSLVASLWSVPDRSTAFLMSAFYQNLQTNPDKAQALRQAMLTTLEQYPNPRDWAAFVLIGQ